MNCPHCGLSVDGAKKTRAPDRLSYDEMQKLEAWVKTRHPWALRDLESIAERCLLHFGAKGESRASWLKTVQTWIGRMKEFGRDRAEPPDHRPRRPKPAEAQREMKASPELRAQGSRLLAELVAQKGRAL